MLCWRGSWYEWSFWLNRQLVWNKIWCRGVVFLRILLNGMLVHTVCLFLLEYNACDLWQCLIKNTKFIDGRMCEAVGKCNCETNLHILFRGRCLVSLRILFSGLALTQVACTSNLFWNKQARTAVGMKFERKQASGSVKRSHLYHVYQRDIQYLQNWMLAPYMGQN